MMKSSSQYPPEKTSRHAEYSGGLVDENIVPAVYSEGEKYTELMTPYLKLIMITILSVLYGPVPGYHGIWLH